MQTGKASTSKEKIMFKYIINSGGENINWMAIFSLLTFVTLFLISIVAMWGKSKSYVNHMESLPLDEDQSNQ